MIEWCKSVTYRIQQQHILVSVGDELNIENLILCRHSHAKKNKYNNDNCL